MKRRARADRLDPARSVRDEFYPRGRKRGIVVRIQVDYSVRGRLLRYSLTLIDVHNTAADHGRVLGYDNAHGYHHRHVFAQTETVEFESYENLEKRFEAEVRRYLEKGEL